MSSYNQNISSRKIRYHTGYKEEVTMASIVTPVLSSTYPTSVVATGPTFTLYVYGTAFVSGSTVRWNGVPLNTIYTSSSQLKATVPASRITSPGFGAITVSSGLEISNQLNVSVLPTPITSGLSPSSASVGTELLTISVYGSNFRPTSVVLWAGTPLTTGYVSETELTAVVTSPFFEIQDHVSIKVSDTGATSNHQIFEVGGTPTGGLVSVSPSSLPQGSGTISNFMAFGSGFTPSMTVVWNGSTFLPTTFVSPNQLQAEISSTLMTVPMNVPITVTNSTGSVNFTVTGGTMPQLTFLTPSSVPVGSATSAVLITGSGFNSNSVAKWNSTQLSTTFISSTQLIAVIPENLLDNPATSTITVGTSNGLQFNVTPDGPIPTLSFLYPTSTPVGSSELQLAAFGIGFTPDAKVRWNNTPLSTTFVFSNLLIATVPSNLMQFPGTASIKVVSSAGTSNTLPFTVGGASTGPVVDIWGPQTSPVNSSNLQITFIGTGFTGNMRLVWTSASSGVVELVPFLNTSTTVSVMIPGGPPNDLLDQEENVSIFLRDPVSLVRTPAMPFSIV